jgi:hypothetical protein
MEPVMPGPKPNPSQAGQDFLATLPTTTVVPPIEALLADARSLLKAGVDSLKLRGGQLSPLDVRVLEGLMRTAQLVLNMDEQVKESLRGRLDKLSKDQLDSLLNDPEALKQLLERGK